MYQSQLQLKTSQRHVRYERPRDVRFPLSRRGELIHKGSRVPCLIQDISVSGISGICTRYVEVGQQFEVAFDLTPDCAHQCKVELRYVDNGSFGAEIVDISQENKNTFDQYLEERFKELKRR